MIALFDVFANLQTPLNSLAYLLRSRAGNALLDVAVFEDAECGHLAHAEFLCDVFALFDVVGVEFDLVGCVSTNVTYYELE